MPPSGCGGCIGGTCDGKDGSDGTPCFIVTGKCTQRTYGGPLLFAYGQENISIRGGCTLDGCGHAWWPKPLGEGKGVSENRGRLIALVRCENITIEDVHLRNAGSFNINPYYCRRMRVNNITIVNPWRSPNTDGFDPAHCSVSIWRRLHCREVRLFAVRLDVWL